MNYWWISSEWNINSWKGASNLFNASEKWAFLNFKFGLSQMIDPTLIFIGHFCWVGSQDVSHKFLSKYKNPTDCSKSEYFKAISEVDAWPFLGKCNHARRSPV